MSTSDTSSNPKCLVWSQSGQNLDDIDPLNRGIPRKYDDGITFWGAPVGNLAFTRKSVAERVDKVKAITNLLPNLQKPHLEFVLLRSCIAIPEIMFTLRTVPTTQFPELLKDFDAVIRETLIQILGTPLDEKQWLQVKLPICQGGLGIRGAEDHAGVAYSSSYTSSKLLVRKLLNLNEDTLLPMEPDILNNISVSLGMEPSPEMLDDLTQKQLSSMVDGRNLATLNLILEDDNDLREKARLNSLSLPHAGAWLEAVPIPALGLYLQPSEFVLAMRYRPGCPVYDRSGPCPACQRHSDVLGDHAMCCAHQGERITRRNAIRDAIHNIAAAAALNPIKERQNLLPENNRRPADILGDGQQGYMQL